MAAPRSWHCPICLRHVPAKVPECYCGYKRGASAGTSRAPGRTASLVTGALLVLGAGAALAYWLRPAPPPLPSAAGALTASPGVPAAAPRLPATPASTTLPAAWRALAIEPPATPSPVVVPSAPGSVASAGSSPESVDIQRRRGQEALERGLEATVVRVTDFWGLLRRFNDQCVRENTHVVGCEPARRDLREAASRIASEVEALDEAARKSWVDPGVRRGLRERNGLDENGVNAVVKAAADAAGS